MTSKQKVQVIAAQFVAKARSANRIADAILVASDEVDEATCERIYRLWELQGIVDGDGNLDWQKATSASEPMPGFARDGN